MTDWVDKIATWTIWVGMTIYMLWAFAKMFGWINTPQAIVAIPYVVGGLVLISYFVRAGRFLERFDGLENRMARLEKKVDRNTDSISALDKRLFRVEMKLQ